MAKIKIKTCKKCGCTDEDCSGCIEKTGFPCYWVSNELCSACANEITMKKYLVDQMKWSRKNFGTSRRTKGIIEHIKKELIEVEENPTDLTEWIDVMILAFDGYWRHGGLPSDLMPHLIMKQRKNFKRVYPFPTSDDVPSEHIRSKKK